MKYVIIGGDAAGMSAAMQIVRGDESAEVKTLERGEVYSYAQCGLPYVAGGVIDSFDSLIARSVDTFRDKYGIDARINHEVKAVDVEKKLVSGDDFEVHYDKLLIATGASPVVPPWDGADLQGIHSVKTIPDTKALVEDLDGVSQIAVIGGGYIGLEMAENFVELGKEVTIIERGDHLAGIFDKDISEKIGEEARKHGVTLRLNESVESFEAGKSGRVQQIVTDKGRLDADLVVVAIGVKPNTGFLDGTGIHLHENGAIKVSRFMETNIRDVYAAGDCATQYHRMKERDDYIPLGTHANKQGRLAGRAMIGSPRPFQGIVGTSIIKFFDLTLARTGLSEAEIESQGYPFKTITASIPHIAGYYPEPKKMDIRLSYHAESEVLLGGQIIGEAGVDKRIDVLATALYHKMRISELEDLDLAYAPPYNGVWDPIQQVARRKE
ncbi:FAD-dependent oxidoreductase [Halalkalibacter kiskunsagensis]|uniref:FAD-dependent oxidoreductase n=1 Tax=Halalkalibacter kiskunsagensis TaxID=1548599 RepID=A0ABV6KF76_9BACI